MARTYHGFYKKDGEWLYINCVCYGEMSDKTKVYVEFRNGQEVNTDTQYTMHRFGSYWLFERI